MKKVLLTLALFIVPLVSFAYTSPGKPTGFVNDFAGILSTSEKASIETKLATAARDLGFQVSVVTVESLGGETIERYATELFEEWGIGDKAKDAGVLILVAIGDRSVRIETGYGAEGAVTDIQAGNIIRNVMVPAFGAGSYFQGLNGASDAIISILAKSPEAEKYSEDNQNTISDRGDIGFNIEAFFFIFIILINIFARILGKTKSWWLGGVLGAIVGAVLGLIFGFVYIGIISIIILTILGLLFDLIVSKGGGFGSGSHGGWIFPMGGKGGGLGGGFGGFGGGMSGGGGASGKW